MEEKRKSILRGLESDLASVNEQTTAFETRFTAATKVLDQLKSGTYTLHWLITVVYHQKLIVRI